MCDAALGPFQSCASRGWGPTSKMASDMAVGQRLQFQSTWVIKLLGHDVQLAFPDQVVWDREKLDRSHSAFKDYDILM